MLPGSTILFHSFLMLMDFVSDVLNAIYEDLSFTVSLLVVISLALIGAAEDPAMTMRLVISPMPPTGFFSPVLLIPMLGM